jgi:hypothetical protein
MSAQPSYPDKGCITLKGKSRELLIRLSFWGDLCVSVYARKRTIGSGSLAFAYREIAKCRLDNEGGWSLWVGNANFTVTPKEADEIHATFAPLGLKSAFTP